MNFAVSTKPIALIPAYKPTQELLQIIQDLQSENVFEQIICVNDGSGEKFNAVFDLVKAENNVKVLTHAVNLGKGSALKTGFNYIVLNFPKSVGVVTLDADGQHLASDCAKVARALEAKPASLIMGTRTFDDSKIPFRSRFGNIITSKVLKFFISINLKDTQTGLRGLPLSFAKDLLRLRTVGYDFELDMLIKAKQDNIKIIEEEIKVIYIDNNSSSHFNPVFDSMKVYLVFLRYNLSSLLSACIDYILFMLAITLFNSPMFGQFIGRFVSGTCNFYINKNIVFKSKEGTLKLSFKYILNLVFSGILAYLLIICMNEYLGISIYIGKIIAEVLLFFLNFFIQKELVFINKDKK